MESAGASQKNILVVDDEITICEFFETILSSRGFKVCAVQSGDKALSMLKEDLMSKTDLIVLDLMMPDRGGYDVLKILQGPGFQKAPIIIITARALDQITMTNISLEPNVKGFFQKPVDAMEFLKKVNEVLGTEKEK